MRVALLLPAYNAGERLAPVLTGAIQILGCQNILVVDDGSEDDTAAVVQASGVHLLRHTTNQGKGKALRSGFRWVLAQSYAAVLTMDADGQHDWRDIPRFLQRGAGGDVDLLIGVRPRASGEMPVLRRLSNALTTLLVSLCAGQRIEDSQCGYRWIHRSVLQRLGLQTNRYETESELLIKAGRLGFRIGSIPIGVWYGNEPSFIKPFNDTVRFLRLVLQSLFW